MIIHCTAHPAVFSWAGVLLLSQCFANVFPPKATYDNFLDLDYDRTQEICDVGGTLNQTMSYDPETCNEWTSVAPGDYSWRELFLIEGFCHDNHSLIHETDADALAVVLRRTEALLNHLKVMPGAPDLSALEQEFIALKSQSAGVDPSNSAARKELYYQACAVRRKIAFSNPLLQGIDKLLFVEHDPSHNPYLHMTRQYYGFHHKGQHGGGLYYLEDPFGPNPERVDALAEAGNPLSQGVYLSPELTWDGQTIYFAWCAATGDDTYGEENCFHLYKVNVDGSGFQKLTSGRENDFDPLPLPNGRVAFISTRRSQTEIRINLRCGAMVEDAYTLHSMKPDGRDIFPLSFHETHEWHPSVDNNGMILYTRWDYVDRGSNEAHHIWTCYPDGRDPRAPHGNYDHPWGDRATPYSALPYAGITYPESIRSDVLNPGKGGSHLHPWGEWNARAIPGSHKYIATAAAHHCPAFGSLITIDPRVEDDGMMSQLKRVTPECLFPEAEFERALVCNAFKELKVGWHYRMKQYYLANQYATAWPLDEDFYICNYWKNIILLDRFGNKEVLYTLDWDNPEDYRIGFRPIDPMPVRPREKPQVLATRTYDGEDAPDDHPRATISVQNIYETYPVDWPEGVEEQRKIKWMRIVQYIPKTTPGKNDPEVGDYDMATCRMSLGIVPVEEDGSVYCNAPVGVPIYFQALDENQMAVQSMKSLTYVHKGEQLSCVGCHESKWKAIPPLPSTPTAFKRSPSPIEEEFPGHHTDPGKGAIPFNYHLLAKPALQRAGYGGEYKCYWAPRGGSRSIPGYVGAHASDIGGSLLSKYQSGSINDEDFHRIVMWIDLNSNELGWDRDADAQKAGQVVWPEIDVDRSNVVATERHLPAPESLATAAHVPYHGDPERISPERERAIGIRRQGASLVITNVSPGAVRIRLWDTRGKTVLRRGFPVSDQAIRISLSAIPEGMYVFRVEAHNGIRTGTVSTVR